MNNKLKLLLLIFSALAFGLLLIFLIGSNNIALLNPKGPIASQERNLIFFALFLASIIVIPTIFLAFVFAWKFREEGEEKYEPEEGHSKLLEIVWWAIPTLVISILALAAWGNAHALDPRKPLVSAKAPLTIQVIALQWKWLFVYPAQNIATVNFVQFPTDTPVNFELTADAPMNSFWIPQLGSQIYAMPGMKTHLNLLASQAGIYAGSSAEISGRGFAGMKFTAKASSQEEFDTWVQNVLGSSKTLDISEYNALAKPSEDSPKAFYSSTEENLFDQVLNKFMLPSSDTENVTGAGED